jgi:hypothetical protein
MQAPHFCFLLSRFQLCSVSAVPWSVVGSPVVPSRLVQYWVFQHSITPILQLPSARTFCKKSGACATRSPLSAGRPLRSLGPCCDARSPKTPTGWHGCQSGAGPPPGSNQPLPTAGSNRLLTAGRPSLSSPCARSRHVMVVGRPAAPNLDPRSKKNWERQLFYLLTPALMGDTGTTPTGPGDTPQAF